ncbi:MAG: SDR family oxidoreductase [Deltaproteobacteria bacterium]|nr:SDR family oxidoreductase [Deltaproteobacteria bacterium]MCB9478087.1 SDR family oxidoreductase [Deltaproteobacteria bacterium]
MGLKDKVAIVCASSKGMGRACAEALAGEGAHVVLCARHKDALKDASDAVREAGVRAVPVVADMTSEEDRARLVQTAESEFGRVDVLINNAGGPAPGSHTDHTIQDFRNAVELSMISSIDMTARVLPGMRERGFGRVINITSIAVKQPIVGLIMSNTARTGLVGYMKTVATEVAADGVTVNNICPGLILTDRMYDLLGENATIDMKPPEGGGLTAELVGSIPMKRMGKPEEVGALAAFLASDKASFITGVSILIDGGAYKGLH